MYTDSVFADLIPIAGSDEFFHIFGLDVLQAEKCWSSVCPAARRSILLLLLLPPSSTSNSISASILDQVKVVSIECERLCRFTPFLYFFLLLLLLLTEIETEK